MTGYTKLFNSILDSTIWDQGYETRLVWITMLAMVDKNGEVQTSVNNLSTRSKVPLDKVNEALTVLTSPDPESRTPDFEGRRIEKVNGGWKLLNYKKYRRLYVNEDRREYMRKYMREYRKPVNSSKLNVNSGKQKLAQLANSIYTTSDKVSIDTNLYSPPIIPPIKTSTENQKTKIRTCRLPGCSNPVGPSQAFCSQTCYDYAVLLETKYGNGELKR